jgi:hypothetical protein
MFEELFQAAAGISAESILSFLGRGLLLHFGIRLGVVLAIVAFAVVEGVIQDRSSRRRRRWPPRK